MILLRKHVTPESVLLVVLALGVTISENGPQIQGFFRTEFA